MINQIFGYLLSVIPILIVVGQFMKLREKRDEYWMVVHSIAFIVCSISSYLLVNKK